MNPELLQQVEKAFDYRGDVTVQTLDGRSLVGFVFNREPKGSKKCQEPYLELMPSTSSENILVRYAEVKSIELTGEDTAAGKSWDEWHAKEEARKASAGKR